jgi:hypothetical protein
LWYHGTIDLNTPTADGVSPDAQTITATMRTSPGWWSAPEAEGSRGGFYYSRIRGGTYTGGTRSGIGYTLPASPFREPWAITASGADTWDNVEIAGIDAAEVYADETFQVDTWFYDLNNDATITWGLDPDSNPYSDAAKIELASVAVSSLPLSPGESLTTPRFISQTLGSSGVPPGTYTVYAQISNGTNTRYYYSSNEAGLHVVCNDNGDCDDGLFCNGAEACMHGSCLPGIDPCADTPHRACDETANQCVECLTTADCDDLYVCENAVCVPECTLSIDYKPLLAEKLTKPRKMKLKITGGEGFDPYGEVEVGPFEIVKTKIKIKKNRLKVKALVPAGYPRGLVPVRVGACIGNVEIM